jgi:polyribonucleotide nucleotidyltransferase
MTLLVAGTMDAITMVESRANEASEQEMLKGLEYAHNLIKDICNAQKDFIQSYKEIYGESTIKAFYNLPDETLYGEVEKYLTEEKLEILYGK